MLVSEHTITKVAFMTLKELFEPMVMFFGLTNSLVTF